MILLMILKHRFIMDENSYSHKPTKISSCSTLVMRYKIKVLRG